MRYLLTSLMFFTLSLGTVAQETADGDAQASAQDDDKALSVEEILQRDPQREDYGDSPRCLQAQRIRQMDVIDEKHISIQVSRQKYYLVQFDHRCPGLRRGKPIMYEPSGGNRLCVLDGIRGIYEGIGSNTPGPRCAINGFQSVTKEQLVLLKDALKVEKRKKKDS